MPGDESPEDEISLAPPVTPEVGNRPSSNSLRIPLLVVMALYFVNLGAGLSLQAPFYPKEAEAKGATPSEYGLSFGILSLASFIASPFCIKYGDTIGPMKLCAVGFLLNAASTICFGLLEYVDTKNVFLAFSYILRFALGCADAMLWCSANAMLMNLFPDKQSLIMGSTESSQSIGYSLGPALGSALYSVGGFSLPFYVLGSTILVLTVISLYLLKKVRTDENSNSSESTREAVSTERTIANNELKFGDVFQSFLIMDPFVDNFMASCGVSLVESMLSAHLRDDKFDQNPIHATDAEVGWIFVVNSVAYLVTCPLVGLACEKMKYPVWLSILGNSLLITSFTFLGPAPSLQNSIRPSLGYMYGIITIFGVGYSLIMITTFTRALRAMKALGYDTEETTTQMVATGMWNATFALGTFIGPTLGGVLVDYCGFSFTAVVYTAFFACGLFLNVSEVIYYKFRWRAQEDYEEIP